MNDGILYRFGKTISVSMFAAAMLYAAPNVECSIYSTCKRISQKLLRNVCQFLDLIYVALGVPKYKVIRANMEELVVQGPETAQDRRVVNSYPSKVKQYYVAQEYLFACESVCEMSNSAFLKRIQTDVQTFLNGKDVASMNPYQVKVISELKDINSFLESLKIIPRDEDDGYVLARITQMAQNINFFRDEFSRMSYTPDKYLHQEIYHHDRFMDVWKFLAWRERVGDDQSTTLRLLDLMERLLARLNRDG